MKAVIFDLWNTLASKKLSVSKILKEHFGINDSSYFEKYEKVLQTKNWKNKQVMAEHFLKSFNIPVLSSNINFVIDTFDEGMRSAELFQETLKTLDLLKGKYKLAVLSNTHPFEVLKKEWKIDHFFDAIFYSFQTGNLKPSKEAFDTVLKILNVKAKECILVDDNHKNLLTGEVLGMKTFENIRELKKSKV